MNGTGTQRGWGVARITLYLYPFGAGAMAINVFFLSLLGTWVGLPVLSAGWAIMLGCLVGIPATHFFARHIRSLMDRVDLTNE